jgi:probable HAF family extracellular repeat protein
MRRTLRICLMLTSGLAFFQALQAASPVYALIDIGTLGGTYGFPNDLNNRGEVVGAAAIPGDTALHPFLYTNGQTIDLGTLGGCCGDANAINDRGQVTGAAGTTSGQSHGFFYNGTGTIYDFGTPETDTSDGAAINAAGQVTGSGSPSPSDAFGNHLLLFSNGILRDLTLELQVSAAGCAINAGGQITGTLFAVLHAFRYANGAINDLGTLGGPTSNSCFRKAINDGGQVVGTSQVTSHPSPHAFLSNPGSPMIDLGTFGGAFSGATAINNSGEVTGSAATVTGAAHAFSYRLGTLIDLGTLGGENSVGYDINDSGMIVGESQIPDGTYHAFLYSGGVMMDLNTLIQADSNRILERALQINERGEISGSYLLKGQNRDVRFCSTCHVFLLTPIHVPQTKDDCRNDGWRNLSRRDGTTFKNQGDCVSYVNTGR